MYKKENGSGDKVIYFVLNEIILIKNVSLRLLISLHLIWRFT